MGVQSCKSIARTFAFAHAARCYWLRVFPCARAELSFWRQRAQQIPDPTLRKAALNALRTKSDLLEGAVAFAVFVPSAARRDVVRAIAAFEIAFDYLDNVVEMPNPDPVLNSRSLCGALHSMIEPRQIHPDYYQYNMATDDGGYLEALVNRCRLSFTKLPSYPVVAEAVRRTLLRIITYQSLNHADADGSHDAFREWARSQSVPEMRLQWWETGAAMGSQLSVLALIAAAANSSTSVEQVKAIERVYFPWFGALSTLLDSVIDQHVDRTENQWSLVDYYGSPEVTAKRLQLMAVEVRRAVVPLADASNHTMILAAMAAFFHSRPEASTSEAGQVTRAVLHAVGGWAMPALIFFRTQRALRR